MATRDLTHAFVQIRDEAKSRILRRKNMMQYNDSNFASNEPRQVEMERNAPKWVNAVEEMEKYTVRIKEKMEALNQLHTKRLMVRFDGSESLYEEEIEQATLDITREFRLAEKLLTIKQDPSVSAVDAKARQNVQIALATQLQNLSSDFRKSQKEYLTRVKHQKQAPVEFDFLSESERAGQGGMSFQAQLNDVDFTETLIYERDQEIQKIATSITELATIFKELAVLVIDQGTILDRIDYNMEQVVEQTEKGVLELEKAETTQKSGGPMKCIGILLGLIFLMTALLVLKHS